MPMINTVGNLTPQQLEGYSKNDIQNVVGQLEKQRANLEKQRETRHSDELDKRITNIEDRIKTLKKRINEADDGECETCANRKYQDGSDDPGVSFKTASKVSGNAEAAVRSHEQEHVSRNRAKAEREGSEIVYQSVIIKHAICPECGTTYVSGGETTTVTQKVVSNDGAAVEGLNSKNTVGGENSGDRVNGVNSDDPKRVNEDGENFGKFEGIKIPTREEYTEKFNVGLYDRAAMQGQLLNVLA